MEHAMELPLDLFEFAAQRCSAPDSSAVDVPPEFHDLVDHLLLCCSGRDRARTAAQIAADLGWTHGDPARTVRELLSVYYRQLTFPVCSSSQGFFVSRDPEDLTRERASLYSRLRCLAARISALDHVARRCGFERSTVARTSVYRPSTPVSVATNSKP